MKELTIIDELKNLLPPLTDAEFTGLEESILKDGCLSPLVVWNDILVDGHHRYEICRKHQIAYAVKNVELASLEDAQFWAWQHQDNRRNLTPFIRAEIALQFKGRIAAKARERQRCGQGGILLPANLPEAKETREEIAELAGISPRSMTKVEYIVEHADEETKEKLRKGEKGTSIDKEYNRLKKQSSPKSEQSVTAEDVTETPISETVPEPSPAKETKYFPKTTLRLISQESPHGLLVNLFEIFRKGYVEEMIVMAMEMLDKNRCAGSAQAMLSQLNKKFGKK
jgi:hypothetical protein